MSGDIRERQTKTLRDRPTVGAIIGTEHQVQHSRDHERAEKRPYAILENRFSSGESEYLSKLAILNFKTIFQRFYKTKKLKECLF